MANKIIYNNSPLTEVVMGVTFEPLQSLKIPHTGLFWQEIMTEFPSCEHARTIGDFDSIIDQITGLPMPTVWFVNESDDNIIQLQKNKFIFNWRKREGKYPHFENVFNKFEEFYNRFTEFVKKHDLGELKVTDFELSYINNILQGEGWEKASDIGKVFPDIIYQDKETSFLKEPKGIHWFVDYPIEEITGTLGIKVQHAKRNIDSRPLYILQLTAIGKPNSPLWKDIKKNFNVSHDIIVGTFEDVTNKDIQKEQWAKQ